MSDKSIRALVEVPHADAEAELLDHLEGFSKE
jgi:hypothetical protein